VSKENCFLTTFTILYLILFLAMVFHPECLGFNINPKTDYYGEIVYNFEPTVLLYLWVILNFIISNIISEILGKVKHI